MDTPSSRRIRPHPGWPAVLLALALALTGCGGADATKTRADTEEYVALGDSYTSGPGIDPMTPGSCLRSTVNYPALVAEALHLEDVDDVSCGGAATTNLVTPQTTLRDSPEPQLDAVDSNTDVVTIGMGFNDLGLSYGLLFVCLMRDGAETEGCQQALAVPEDQVNARIEAVARRVAASLQAIEERAPKARVILVGYPRIVPDTGSCPDRLPLPEAMVERVRRAMALIDEEWKKAAKAEGADYVDMYAASKGHDICSDDPWVAGSTDQPGRAAALHPFREYHVAVAQRIESLLRKSS